MYDPAADSDLRRGRLGRPLMRFAKQAAPTTFIALLLLAALYVSVPAAPTDLPGLAGLYLVLIAVLTLPHVGVVSLMDRAEGIWGSGDPTPEAADPNPEGDVAGA